MSKSFSYFCFLLICLQSSQALIHQIKIEDDSRGSFPIEGFGFQPGGELELNMIGLRTDIGSILPQNHQFGFLIKRSESNSGQALFLNSLPEGSCPLSSPLEPHEVSIPIKDWESTSFQMTVSAGGFYHVYFISCDASSPPISFNLELVMFNPGFDYLSTGEAILPSLYLTFTLLYTVLLVIWCYLLATSNGSRIIHLLMMVALVLKLIDLFFHAVELYFLRLNGHPGGWTWIYLAFDMLKGTSFVTVIALIGSGWAFLKPFLNDRDRKLFMIVIPLQLVSNLALAVVEETSPGTRQWLAWYDILHAVDLLCCAAVLLPIVRSIQHLQKGAGADGRGARNVEQLKMFRQFYLTVISYFYFTRIVVFLLESVLDYRWTWFADFFMESCTLLFFVSIGNTFGPSDKFFERLPISSESEDLI